jgi:hypothetical protein
LGERYPETPGIRPDTLDIGVRRLRTRQVLQTGNSNPDTLGIRPDTPDALSGHSGRVPDIPGWTLNFIFKSLLSVEMVSYDFCGFS